MATVRDVSSLPLSRSSVELLLKSGFRFIADVLEMQPLDLAQEIGVSADVALKIIKTAQESTATKSESCEDISLTAKDILTKHGSTRHLITFSRQIDVMLGGGIPVGQITEFCGVPGVHKKQCLCFYLPNIVHVYIGLLSCCSSDTLGG
jgi:RAD51-like protein 2